MALPGSAQKTSRYSGSQWDAARTKVGLFRLQTVITTAIVAVLALIFVWPFLNILGATFKSIDAGLRAPLWPIPSKISFTFYEMTFGERYGFPGYIWNSVKVAVLSTALSSFTCTLTGYALAKLRFAGRDFLFSLIIGVMLLPTTTMLVPQYVVMRDLHLTNTHWGLILPAVGGGAFGIFLMRQFMQNIPTEMLEAARIDGANEFDLFFRIVLPNAKAGIAVIATLSLRGNWNSLLWPQIMLSDQSKQLLMPAIAMLNQMLGANVYALPVVWTASVVASVVPLALYAYSQRYFISTLAGAIKG